ncbi:MAG: hypothetical protein H0T53_16960 [Herpetosiphonaceae bacterium]|nr:hypothetical protein [Herpetosiphonaceae bacterium]
MSGPFRWNLAKLEQLGRMVERSESPPEAAFVTEIQQACVRILGQAGDADLVFIGRSPANLFDYLSGILADTSWATRCTLINVSLRADSIAAIRHAYPTALPAIYAHLTAAGLAPAQICRRSAPIALVDLVDTGTTFGLLLDLWRDWAVREGCDPAALVRRLRLVGITIQQPTSPKTWRWHQHAPWTRQLRPSAIKNVSLPGHLWRELGNSQPKHERWNPPWRWGDALMAEPPRDQTSIDALWLALQLYTLGSSRLHRQEFARRLVHERAMREAWCRTLAQELRGMRPRG